MTRRASTDVSACLIVRDEAKVLRRCLESIQGAYDQLCILDTGSVDDTPKIAKEFGAKFKRFTRCNDGNGRIANFALARNECMRMAKGKWILSIDAR